MRTARRPAWPQGPDPKRPRRSCRGWLELWGAARRLRIPFFMGIGASVLNVVAQLTVLLLVAQRRATSQGDPLLVTVLIILGVGLVLCILAVLVERQRARLIAQAREWRVALESWD